MEKYLVIISREMIIEKHLIIIIILDRMVKEKKEPASSFISKVMYYFVSNVSQSVSALRVTSVIVFLPILIVEAVQLFSAQKRQEFTSQSTFCAMGIHLRDSYWE